MTKHIGRALVVLTGTMLAGAMLATPASAHHNIPHVEVSEPGECGVLTINSAWVEDTHRAEDAKLVVQVGNEQYVADIGESIEVGPFDMDEARIFWRVWGGGERDYDDPPLSDLDALLEHLNAGGDELDFDVPGVAWNLVTVEGCVEDDDDDVEPTPSPSTPADDDNDDADNVDDGKDDDAGTGGGDADDSDTLPVTGAPAALIAGAGAALLGAGLVLRWALKRRAPKFVV